MTRKLIATITAALLALALLPAPAFANVPATANLAQANRDVFPGNGQNFTVNVTNGGSSGFLGLGGGSRINYVSIIVPGSRGFKFSETDFPPPQGWFRTVISEGTSQEVVYTAPENNRSGIAPGATQAFQFPLDVAAPPSSDRNGRFAVGVSSNRGHDISMATGALDSLVRVLEVLEGTVIAPLLAADGTASAGQAVTYGVTVKNHAANTLTGVNASLRADSGDTVTSQPDAADIPGGDEHTFPFGVTFGDRAQDGTSEFTASATATSSAAREALFTYGVQVPPFLEFHEDTFRPRSVQPEPASETEEALTYVFRADFTKRNNPGLTILSDDEDGTSTLAFADTVVELADGQTFGGNGDRAEVASRSTSVQGEDGEYHVDYDITAIDGNGYVFPLEIRSSQPIVSIDALAPVIENLRTILPNGQTHAKNGDTIRVTGEVKDRTAQPDGLSVTLREVGTQTIEPTNVSTTVTPDGYTFEATFRPTFEGDEGDFRAEVTAVDDAGNTGSDTGELLGIDNIIPDIADLGYAVNHPVTGEIVIQVVFDENNFIRGGCDPRLYRVGGQTFQPRAVHYSDGSPCQTGQAGPQGVDADGNEKTPTNSRLLLLQSPPSSRDYQSWVEYNPGRLFATDAIRDGANNRAVEGVQDIVARIVPPLPELSAFKRNNGEEPAVFDEDVYWTRFGGSDFTVEVGNVVSNERVEVVDQNGTVIDTAAYDGGNSVTATVPIGTSEGIYTRGVRLHNVDQNLRGEIKWIDIALDTTAPAIASAVRQGADSDQVVVTFTDVVWDGSNAAANWRAFEDDEEGDGPARMAVTDARGERDTRTLTVDFQGYGDFIGVEYRLLLGDNYEDRAGNLLANPLFHPAG